MTITRRNLLTSAGAAAASTLLARTAGAQSFPFTPNQRYPDPAVQILDPGFAKYRIYSSTVEQVATGMADDAFCVGVFRITQRPACGGEIIERVRLLLALAVEIPAPALEIGRAHV